MLSGVRLSTGLVGDAVLVGVGVDEGVLLGDPVGVVVGVARGVPVGAAVDDAGTLGDATGDDVPLGEAVSVLFAGVVSVGVGLSAAEVDVAVAPPPAGVGVSVAAPEAVGVAALPPPFPAHAARQSTRAANSGHRLQVRSMFLSSADPAIGARECAATTALWSAQRAATRFSTVSDWRAVALPCELGEGGGHGVGGTAGAGAATEFEAVARGATEARAPV